MNPESIIYYVNNDKVKATSKPGAVIKYLYYGNSNLRGATNIPFTNWIVQVTQANFYVHDLLTDTYVSLISMIADSYTVANCFPDSKQVLLKDSQDLFELFEILDDANAVITNQGDVFWFQTMASQLTISQC